MHRRWYDNDPTLSMAVSLLQNASKQHQEITAQMLLAYIKQSNLYELAKLNPNKISFIFPLMRRLGLDTSASEALEVMKRLPHGKQLELALMMIHHIYLLETGYEQDEHWLNDIPSDDPCLQTLEKRARG